MSYAKTKKNKSKKKLKSSRKSSSSPAKPAAQQSFLGWDDVRKLPVSLWLTGGPPIMGFTQVGSTGIRIYAPAHLIAPSPTTVLFQPPHFVEDAIELFWSALRGQSPKIPDIIMQGYAGYFERYIQGGYRMQPVAIAAGITEVHEETMPEPPAVDPDKPAPMEKCPACEAELSSWRAHYPVVLPLVNDGPPISAGSRWICEMIVPDIREKYPNYTPPEPVQQEEKLVH